MSDRSFFIQQNCLLRFIICFSKTFNCSIFTFPNNHSLLFLILFKINTSNLSGKKNGQKKAAFEVFVLDFFHSLFYLKNVLLLHLKMIFVISLFQYLWQTIKLLGNSSRALAQIVDCFFLRSTNESLRAKSGYV